MREPQPDRDIGVLLSEAYNLNPYELRLLWNYLVQQFPQLNPTTKVSWLHRLEREVRIRPSVNLGTVRSFDRTMANLPPQPLSWRSWYRGLFVSAWEQRTIDDPDARLRYARRVHHLILSVPRMIWHRLNGRYVRELVAYAVAYNRVATVHMPPMREDDVVQIVHIASHRESPFPNSWREHRDLYEAGWQRPFIDVFVGYHPATDTLYVWRDK